MMPIHSRVLTANAVHRLSRKLLASLLVGISAATTLASATAIDPGVQTVADRGANPAPCPNNSLQPFDPAPLPGLTGPQLKLFCAGLEEFRKVDAVKADGLGPTMNLDSCVGCHAYPASGGTSPPKSIGNPQIALFRKYAPGTNVAPSFITADGPVREVRFIHDAQGHPDGGVHSLFTITGLPDADGCLLKQPDFAKEFKGTNKPGNNVIFRIPTPIFGTGLIEQIQDQTLIDNQEAKRHKSYLGLGTMAVGRLNIVLIGHAKGGGGANHNGNDGTIARFGWKAQNKSLLVFAGEAYNVEMGISNELFETERNEEPGCQFAPTPNDTSTPDNLAKPNLDDRYDAYSDIEKFAAFMRFSAPPAPSNDKPGGAASIARGRLQFVSIGCGFCHTPELRTSSHSKVAALNDKAAQLYSDLALHDMGANLADGVSQGQAGPQEFRTAPLWGLGQRAFFLHDGRADNLVKAIEDHYSAGKPGKGGSDANMVVRRYRKLPDSDQQDLLNFLRSL
jgi:CxxC motif-containing protein (DUF1111 family)